MGHFFLPDYQMLSPSQHSPARAGRAGRLTPSPRKGHGRARAANLKIITGDTVKQAAVVLIERGREAATSWLVSEGVTAPAAQALLSLLAPTR